MISRVNILVTGATGFIGRHLVGALSKTYSVRCLARKTSDITPLKDLNVDIAYGDLLVKESLGPALDGIDLVYHLAGEVYSRKKSDYCKGNVLTTQNLLEACKEKGMKRVIFLSSIAVYKPAAKEILLTEESDCEPLTIYGKTKLEAEALIKGCNIPWVIVRGPIVYGPYQPPVLNQFFLNAFNKRKVYIVGKKDTPRSYCFTGNLVDGLMLIANRPDTNGKTYILSDNLPYTFEDLVRATSMAIKQEVRVVHLPSIMGNISWQINNLIGKVFSLYFVKLYALKTMQLHWECDISKAKKEIGYSPRFTLEMGIESTMNWIRNSFTRC
jgi:nucleoside-diphosphate-sugar epimerase